MTLEQDRNNRYNTGMNRNYSARMTRKWYREEWKILAQNMLTKILGNGGKSRNSRCSQMLSLPLEFRPHDCHECVLEWFCSFISSVPRFHNDCGRASISFQLLLVSEKEITNKLVSKNSFIESESISLKVRKLIWPVQAYQALGQWGRSKKGAGDEQDTD